MVICGVCHHACHFCDRCGGRESENENESGRCRCCNVVSTVEDFSIALKMYCGVCVLVEASVIGSATENDVDVAVGRCLLLYLGRTCLRLAVEVCDSRHRLANVLVEVISSHAVADDRSRGRTCRLDLGRDRCARYALVLERERALDLAQVPLLVSSLRPLAACLLQPVGC